MKRNVRKRGRMKHFIPLIMLLVTSSVLGDVYNYECDIVGEYIYGAKGELVPEKKEYAGDKFYVERKLGVVLGSSLGNSSYPSRQVLDPGGVRQAYKLIWVSKELEGTNGGKNVGYLNVQEFVKGAEKPFVLIVDSRVLSGVCT